MTEETKTPAAKPAAKAAPKTAAKKPAAKPAAAASKPRSEKPAEKAKPAVTVVRKPSRAPNRSEDNKYDSAPAATTPAFALKVKEVQNKRDITVQQLDAKGRAYATGKRKNAIARVWIMPGKGKITVNERDIGVYFGRPTQRMLITQPFELVNRVGEFDVNCTVVGGGLSGQAGAVRHGLSKALTFYEPALRAILKKAGLLTRDSRVVERKKYGKHKARRSTQWVKR